jgi:hypothetical protein
MKESTKKFFTYSILIIVLLALVSNFSNFGKQSVTNVQSSFTPSSTCNAIGGDRMSDSEATLCRSQGCYVQKDVDYGIGTSLLIDAIVAGGIYWGWTAACNTYWIGTGFFGCQLTAGPVATVLITSSAGVIAGETLQNYFGGFSESCVSCLPINAVTADSTQCCSGFNRKVDRDIVSGFFVGEPYICIPPIQGEDPIDNDSLMCKIGTPLAKTFPSIGDCITAAYISIGAIIVMLLFMFILMGKRR